MTGQQLLNAYPPDNCKPEDNSACTAIATWRFQPFYAYSGETNCVLESGACFYQDRFYFVVVVATWERPSTHGYLTAKTRENINTMYSQMKFWQFAFGSSAAGSPYDLTHKFTRLAPEWKPTSSATTNFSNFKYYNKDSAGTPSPQVNFELGVVEAGQGHDYFLNSDVWIAAKGDPANGAGPYQDSRRVPLGNGSMTTQYATGFSGVDIISANDDSDMCVGCLVHDPVYHIPKIGSNYTGNGFSGFDSEINPLLFINAYQPTITVTNCTVNTSQCGPGQDAPLDVGIETLIARDLSQHTSSHELSVKIVHIYQNTEAVDNHSQWSVVSTLVYSNNPTIPIDPRSVQQNVYHITYLDHTHWDTQRITSGAYAFNSLADPSNANVTCVWSDAQTTCEYDGPCQAACNITYFSNITTHGWNYGAECTGMKATVHGFDVLNPHPCISPDLLDAADNIPDLFQPKRWITIALICVMIPMLVVNLAVHASRTRLSTAYNVEKKEI
jgi:hypothetical protein